MTLLARSRARAGAGPLGRRARRHHDRRPPTAGRVPPGRRRGAA